MTRLLTLSSDSFENNTLKRVLSSIDASDDDLLERSLNELFAIASSHDDLFCIDRYERKIYVPYRSDSTDGFIEGLRYVCSHIDYSIVYRNCQLKSFTFPHHLSVFWNSYLKHLVYNVLGDLDVRKFVPGPKCGLRHYTVLFLRTYFLMNNFKEQYDRLLVNRRVMELEESLYKYLSDTFGSCNLKKVYNFFMLLQIDCMALYPKYHHQTFPYEEAFGRSPYSNSSVNEEKNMKVITISKPISLDIEFKKGTVGAKSLPKPVEKLRIFDQDSFFEYSIPVLIKLAHVLKSKSIGFYLKPISHENVLIFPIEDLNKVVIPLYYFVKINKDHITCSLKPDFKGLDIKFSPLIFVDKLEKNFSSDDWST